MSPTLRITFQRLVQDSNTRSSNLRLMFNLFQKLNVA